MTYPPMKIRPAMTAIAAVIALSSTPLMAQVPEEPVTTTQPPVVEAPPAPVAEDPLAPTAETPTEAEPTTTQAAPPRATRRAATRTTRAQPAARTAPTAPAASPTPEPAAAQPTPVEPVMAEPVPPPVAAPAEQASPAPAGAIDDLLASDEALPIAGAAGLGILALAGTGLVMSRRRRRREEAEAIARQDYAESTPAAEAEPGEITEPQRPAMEPTFVRAFAQSPVPGASSTPVATPTGPSTALPEDFDLSRFGPHVQAAYRGPTKDNPSLSLKYRLRRAAALDQMARKTGAAAAKPAEAPRPAERANGEFLLRRPAMKPAEPGAQPAFSKWPKAEPVK